MQNTANYKFKKPENTDLYNVQDFSDNMDAIDTALKGIEDGTTAVGNALKLNGLTADEFVKGQGKSFASGETVLSWAISPNGVYKKFAVEANGFPSDAPKKAEGYYELSIDGSGNRRQVKFTPFRADVLGSYTRTIYSNSWYTEWTNDADGGNADTVDGKHAIDFARSYSLPNGTDFDSVTESGMYRFGAESPNQPSASYNYGQLLVMNGGNSDTVVQICCSPKGNLISYRGKYGSNPWSAWKRLAHAEDVLPLDGSVPMSGVLQNVKDGSDYRGEFYGAQYGAYISAFHKDNVKVRRSLFIGNTNGRANIKDALTLCDNDGTTEKYYTVLHTGNSAKVVVSSTPLTAEGSIRVW